MKITCLCPTYGRPQSLIENTIALFLAQDHPDKELIFLDDGGTLPRFDGWYWNQEKEEWEAAFPQVNFHHNTSIRFDHLPGKYNFLMRELEKDPPVAIVVWDDDDVYMPWHLSSIAKTLSGNNPSGVAHFWCQPHWCYSTYGITSYKRLLTEATEGRFHGSIAAHWDYLQFMKRQYGNYWPETKRADFDQQMIARLARDGVRGDTTKILSMSSYVFRWQDSGAGHCQGLMSSPENEDWYDRNKPQDIKPFENLTPRFDKSTVRIFNALEVPLPSLSAILGRELPSQSATPVP